jgi:hypothetical protein
MRIRILKLGAFRDDVLLPLHERGTRAREITFVCGTLQGRAFLATHRGATGPSENVDLESTVTPVRITAFRHVDHSTELYVRQIDNAQDYEVCGEVALVDPCGGGILIESGGLQLPINEFNVPLSQWMYVVEGDRVLFTLHGLTFWV